MASFDPELADIRFGCGLSPVLPRPDGVDAVLAQLAMPDDVTGQFPIEDFRRFQRRVLQQQSANRAQRDAKTDRDRDAAREAIRKNRREAVMDGLDWYLSALLRRAWTPAPFRERLVAFWADHFTATGKAGVLKQAQPAYVESAIRPHVARRFEDLLISAVRHPLMLHYLDQDQSAGPNSARAQRSGGSAGLNENLAREVLELHTLGVGGPYSQTDVRELARLFAGMSISAEDGFVFREGLAEPGTKTVLGRRFGGARPPHPEDSVAALRYLARHPGTARHIARKLAQHFVSDRPDTALVGALEAAFLETDGDLTAVYAALLHHPAAWDGAQGKVKQPMDLIGSALRALAVPEGALRGLRPPQINTLLRLPMQMMGHDWGNPAGPDGLPEDDAAWITPQGLAARLQWAMTLPNAVLSDLPDPRDFAATALGARATPAVRFAAEAAETRWEGIGLILASPAFQKM